MAPGQPAHPLYDIDEKDRRCWKRPFQSLHGKKVDDTITFPFPPLTHQVTDNEDDGQ